MTFSPTNRLAALVCLAAASGMTAGAAPLAFSGAEGYGRFASGGRGGQVYIVTNLNDSGPGSLRAATSASGPRTVVFALSGTIQLLSTLRITHGDLTIAGQTAPGDGICLANYPLDPSNSQNVIIRFIRSRLGDVAQIENDAFSCRYADNVIIDHCSFSWGIDETATAYINTNFTMQWCIVSESLRNSFHSKGTHGYGGIWGGMGASFHHNLLAHHDSRNPRFSGAGSHGLSTELVDLRNNVIYNWGFNSCYGGEPVDTTVPSRQNVINNYYKYGPATNTGVHSRVLNPSPQLIDGSYGLFHVAGNYVRDNAAITADNWAGGVQGPTAPALAAMRADPAFAVAPVTTQSATDAYPLILSHAGCVRPARDAVDTRVISEVTNGTTTYVGSKSINPPPGLIDSQADVGGWPVLASGPPPADADADGMPDAWENSRGLNPNDPSDRNLTDSGGYTRLENYLDSLAAGAFPVASSALFATDFAGNTLHAASPVLTPTSTNWYVMSSKNATGSSVGDDPATTSVTETRPLDLTMPTTTSGIAETAAFFAAQPVALFTGNGSLRTRMVFRPTNVLTLGVGMFNSGGTSPHTGLINSLLTNSATTLATGGTQNWLGYRFAVTNTSTVAVIQARPAQPGTFNNSQSLVVPVTSSACPLAVSVGTIPASPAALTFTDGSTYTLTTEISRPSADQLLLSCTIHGGTDTSSTPLFSSSALTTAAGALPSAVTSAFNAIAIGYRNVDSSSVSHLTVTSLEIARVGFSDPYQAFLLQHGLDPLTDGAFSADPDGDGIANGLEFILGGDPRVASRQPLPVFGGNQQSGWTYTFLRHNEFAQVAALVVERGDDLVAWTPLADGVGGAAIEVTAADSSHQLVTVRIPGGSNRLFLRLKATPLGP